MKRDPQKQSEKKQKLVLNRETLRPLDDDALHQVRGGAGAMTSSKGAMKQF